MALALSRKSISARVIISLVQIEQTAQTFHVFDQSNRQASTDVLRQGFSHFRVLVEQSIDKAVVICTGVQLLAFKAFRIRVSRVFMIQDGKLMMFARIVIISTHFCF